MPIATAPSTTRSWGAFISCNSLSPSAFSLPSFCTQTHQQKLRTFYCAVKSGRQESSDSDLLRKLIISPRPENRAGGDEHASYDESGGKLPGLDSEGEGRRWVDWENQILEETVPLVGFVRMILHSDRYRAGDRLSPEHERTILERLLPYHPAYKEKIGCGVDYLTVGYHPQYEESRCLFIVHKDGDFVDFSYWKCIKGLIWKHYPQYADTFIRKHFHGRRADWTWWSYAVSHHLLYF